MSNDLHRKAASYLSVKKDFDFNLDRVYPDALPEPLCELAIRWEHYHVLLAELRIYAGKDSQSAREHLVTAEAELPQARELWEAAANAFRAQAIAEDVAAAPAGHTVDLAEKHEAVPEMAELARSLLQPAPAASEQKLEADQKGTLQAAQRYWHHPNTVAMFQRWGLQREVLAAYKRFRKQGCDPEAALSLALAEWDL